eukprot:3781836-Amphidinium_carterae.2
MTAKGFQQEVLKLPEAIVLAESTCVEGMLPRLKGKETWRSVHVDRVVVSLQDILPKLQFDLRLPTTHWSFALPGDDSKPLQ